MVTSEPGCKTGAQTGHVGTFQNHMSGKIIHKGDKAYPGSGVLELELASQNPGVGRMNSIATCVLPMKLGPKLVTRQSNSSPTFRFSIRIIC